MVSLLITNLKEILKHKSGQNVPLAYTNDEGYIVTNDEVKYPYPCVTYGATMGGNKGGVFKKLFLKFFEENLLN